MHNFISVLKSDCDISVHVGSSGYCCLSLEKKSLEFPTSNNMFYLPIQCIMLSKYIFTCSQKNVKLIAICNLHGIVGTIQTTEYSVHQREQ